VRRAALGSALFLLAAPGVLAGLVPWLLTGWNFEEPVTPWLPFQIAGGALLAAGVAGVLATFARFVLEGLGTPAPVAPTERLVAGGLYRYVRNPMYSAVLATIVGQGLLFGQLGLLLYAAVFWLVVAAFVRIYEEPALRRRFGGEYEAYCRAVPAWLPRLRPWDGAPRA
jgi:protein-S-isoprenylcysteine O-methyltransferase Ste14